MSPLASRILLAASFSAAAAFAGPNDSVWIDLFNPKDTSLSANWDIKIRGEALNADSRRTFRRVVVGSDTVLEVNYDQYTGSFNGDAGPFGHAAYKHRTFSHYLLRSEYQVWGAQATGGPSWALQNNGFMLHSQSMATMTLNQDFPVSLEAQLLGPGNGNGTMNLCTPGTAFHTTPSGGNVNTSHCVNARGDLARAAVNTGWQKVSARVLGDSLIKFMAGPNGTDSAYQFYRPVYYSGNISNPPSGIPANGTALTNGYITIQAESHPYRFRKIQVLNLAGCTTPTDANYKTYFVKHDAAACGLPAGLMAPRDVRAAAPMRFAGNSIQVGGQGLVTLQVFDLRGQLVAKRSARAPFQWTPAVKQSGLHVIRAITERGSYAERAPLF